MRILILSFYYEPDLSAGSFRTVGLVKDLMKIIAPEDQVHVLTTQPNRYASYIQTALSEENQEQLFIKRFSLPAHRNGFMDQACAFISYAYQTLKATNDREYDLVFATSGRLFTATLGAIIAKRKKAKLFLDIRDIFVDTLRDVLPSAPAFFLIPIFRYVEKWTIGVAQHINLVSSGFQSYFQERYPHKLYSAIPNGIDDIFLSIDYQKIISNEKKIVLYAGNIGEGQGLSHIIPNIAQALFKTHEFWIVGDGGQRLDLAKLVSNLTNVYLLPPVERDKLLDLYKRSDILMLHLNKYSAFQKVLPSKLFEYAATGKPIIAGVAGYAASFLKQVPGVFMFPPCNIKEALAAFNLVKDIHIDRYEFIQRFRRDFLMSEMAKILYVFGQKNNKK